MHTTTVSRLHRLTAIVLLIGSFIGLLPAVASANSGEIVADPEGSWPEIVRLSIDNLGAPNGICTGTVVSPWAIITAAHCVDDWEDIDGDGVLDPAPVMGGTITTSPVGAQHPNGQNRPIEFVAIHPTWDPTAFGPARGVDLAIVSLFEPVTAPRLPLSQTPLVEGREVWIGGFGVSSAEARDAGTLRHGTMTHTFDCFPFTVDASVKSCFDEKSASIFTCRPRSPPGLTTLPFGYFCT